MVNTVIFVFWRPFGAPKREGVIEIQGVALGFTIGALSGLNQTEFIRNQHG